jgi:hypothetical protein
MSLYRLPDQLRFCEVGGERVFLDLLADRYFSLPAAADAALSSLLANPAQRPRPRDLEPLLRLDLLVAAPQGRPLAATRHQRPTRSLVEETRCRTKPSPFALVEVGLLVLLARREVARKRLPRALAGLARGPSEGAEPPEDRRDRAVAQFRAARRLVPIAPNCLYDSLALARFLRRRGIRVELVIGVKLHPFGAHCWLQDGATVLNDSLAAAREFEPVLVA